MSDLKDRLRTVRSELEAKREERNDLQAAVESAKKKVADSGIPVAEMTGSDDFKEAEQAVRALGENSDAIADLQLAENGILRMLGENAPTPSFDGGPSNETPRTPQGWNAKSVLDGPAYQNLITSGMVSSRSRLGVHNLGEIASRETAADFFSGRSIQAAEVGTTAVSGLIPADNRGLLNPVLQRLTLLDLIPTGTTDSNIVEYVQINTFPNDADVVAEGAVKPEQSFDTVDADAPVRTVAGWIKVRRQALADYAGLQTLLGTLLPYDVRRKIEDEILNGDGTGQHLLGLLNQTGLGEPALVTDDNQADAILRAVTSVILSDGDPNFVAAHPLVWQDLQLMREDQAARTGAYLFGSPSSPAAPTIWGLNLVTSRAVPQATPLVGDSRGATLLYREGVNTRISDADQDDFIRNRVTLLAEARVAFPVWRPSLFALAPDVTPGP